jgi:hypothetical protein
MCDSAGLIGLATPVRQDSGLTSNLASHAMGERGAEAGLWRAMNHSLRQDSLGGGSSSKLSRQDFTGVWCTVCMCTHTHTHTHILILNLAAGKLPERQELSFKQKHSMMGAFNALASMGNSTP